MENKYEDVLNFEINPINIKKETFKEISLKPKPSKDPFIQDKNIKQKKDLLNKIKNKILEIDSENLDNKIYEVEDIINLCKELDKEKETFFLFKNNDNKNMTLEIFKNNFYQFFWNLYNFNISYHHIELLKIFYKIFLSNKLLLELLFNYLFFS